MSDQPLTRGVLAQVLVEFHRDIIAPDVQRIVDEAIAGSERRMQANFDAIFHKLDKLETEYESLKAGLKRVEERVDQMDQRLEALETQYRDLLASVIRLEERLSRVEERLGRVEGQVDVLVAATENDPLRAEVADLRRRVDTLQAQVRSLEKRFDQ